MARRVGSDGTRTEAALREAALRLIAQHGYEAMSMRQLGEEIGLGAAALYRYFPTKQSLLYSLLHKHMVELLRAWEKVRLPPTRPAAERLETFTRFHIRHHLPRREGVFLSYMELRSLSPENFARIEALRRSYEQDLATILTAGSETGQFTTPAPRVTARAIIAMLTGVTTWYREGGELGPDEIENIYWGMVARMAGLTARRETCSQPA